MAAGKNQTYYINDKNLKYLKEETGGKGKLINGLLTEHYEGATGDFEGKFDNYVTAKEALLGLYNKDRGAVVIINVDDEKIFARINGMAEEDVAVLVGDALAGEKGTIERL